MFAGNENDTVDFIVAWQRCALCWVPSSFTRIRLVVWLSVLLKRVWKCLSILRGCMGLEPLQTCSVCMFPSFTVSFCLMWSRFRCVHGVECCICVCSQSSLVLSVQLIAARSLENMQVRVGCIMQMCAFVIVKISWERWKYASGKGQPLTDAALLPDCLV